MRTVLAAAFLTFATISASASELSLKRVMLSSAGVGYFEYEAEVDGAAALGLDVPLEQVDDVLNSLVVFDSAGGVGTVELPGRDETRSAFDDVPFGPAALNSPIEFLNSLQGVELAVQGPRPMSGRLMHAEVVIETIAGSGGQPPRTMPHTRVTLLGPDGLRQFVLEEADSVQVADPALRDRVAHALEAARRQTSQSMRHLTIRSSGSSSGSRTLRAAYVALAPLWKATYRLVLPSARDSETARLQGWAVLENQSGEEWNGVGLTLQYGNPVTFHQAIYRSYFVERPEVPVEVLGRILPDVDIRSRPAAAPAAGSAERTMRGAVPPPAPAPTPPGAMAMAAVQAPSEMARPAATAEATEAAEETIFRVPMPVVLAAGHSAAVPIIDHVLPAERLDLVPAGSTKPLSALRIRNSTEASLPAGVLTLYDASGQAVFAGDARLGGLPPGETRVLSFAQDLRTTVERDESSNRTLIELAASEGVLHATFRDRDVLTATVTAPADEARLLLVEFARRPDTTFSVEGPPVQGIEETAAAWRVPVALQPGEVRKLVVYRDHLRAEEVVLLPEEGGDNTEAVVAILNEQTLDAKARAELDHIVALRQDAARRRAELDRLKTERDGVMQDEDRIRKNLAAIAPSDALHMRLTRSLDSDETRIAQVQQTIDQARADADRARKALADAVRALKL